MPESSRSRVDFPAPLWPTRSDPVAQLERHGDVPQRLDDDHVGVVAADRAARLTQEGFLQGARLRVEDGEFHPRVVRLDVRTRHRCFAYRYCPCPDAPGLPTPGGQRALAHLLQLCAGGHLLGEQRGLDAVEQPLQPADQLGLGDAQFGVRRRGVLVERQGEAVELLAQFRRQALFEFADAGRVDLAQAVAAGLVERRGAHLLEELLDHGADAHHLGGLLHQIGQGALVGVVLALPPMIRGSTPPMISMPSSS